jgi:NAD(P)-dependent dehydrogenase (short-subunit alcohol dehydrogenase family)
MELQALASDGQLVHSISADLTEAKSSEEAFDTAVKQYEGRVPDYVFNVAGSSRPKYFVDTTAEELEWVGPRVEVLV